MAKTRTSTKRTELGCGHHFRNLTKKQRETYACEVAECDSEIATVELLLDDDPLEGSLLCDACMRSHVDWCDGVGGAPEKVMDDVEPARPVHISHDCPCGKTNCSNEWHEYAVYLGTDRERWAFHYAQLERILAETV
jgi:hypothetical protein